MKGDQERMLAAGCDGYVAKPLDANELGRRIEALIRGGQTERPDRPAP